LRQAVIEALGDQADGVQLLVSAGTASSVLVQAARKFEADLVVLSRRPVHSPAWLLGEVSQHVLRNAPCPVLIVPETTS
jgi:nucleotide-binding universal stress UspA family protein